MFQYCNEYVFAAVLILGACALVIALYAAMADHRKRKELLKEIRKRGRNVHIP